ANESHTNLLGKSFDCYLTTEKGWLKIGAAPSTELSAIAGGTMSENNTLCAEFIITLHGDAPAITNYDVNVHGGTFNVAVPILKVLLTNDDTKPYEYDDL